MQSEILVGRSITGAKTAVVPKGRLPDAVQNAIEADLLDPTNQHFIYCEYFTIRRLFVMIAQTAAIFAGMAVLIVLGLVFDQHWVLWLVLLVVLVFFVGMGIYLKDVINAISAARGTARRDWI